VRRFAAESWIDSKGFIKKDEYYQFSTVLQSRLAMLETEHVPLDHESLVIQRENDYRKRKYTHQ
jgi:hypothetical protein